MKTLSRVVIISFFLASGAAQAAVENMAPPAKTRAEVVSELHDWQARGQSFLASHSGYPVAVPNTNSQSRQQVVDELMAARKAGQVSYQDELNYPPVAAGPRSMESRDQVKADLRDYRAKYGPETF